jgi:glutathione S-transferase
MSKLKIWGRMSSINVKKAVWTAQELGLTFERHEAGGVHGVVKTPPYIALNPNSQIPVMEDGDYVLWESNVIVRYLSAKYAPTLVASRTALDVLAPEALAPRAVQTRAGGLGAAALCPEGDVPGLGRPGASAHSLGNFYPENLQERFDAERWMEWQQTTVNPASRNGFWHLIRLPADQRDPTLIAQSNSLVEPLMAILDAHLATRKFMVGERFTMADIPLGCEVQRWFGLPQARQPRLHIERWFATLLARPAAKGVLDLPLA